KLRASLRRRVQLDVNVAVVTSRDLCAADRLRTHLAGTGTRIDVDRTSLRHVGVGNRDRVILELLVHGNDRWRRARRGKRCAARQNRRRKRNAKSFRRMPVICENVGHGCSLSLLSLPCARREESRPRRGYFLRQPELKFYWVGGTSASWRCLSARLFRMWS